MMHFEGGGVSYGYQVVNDDGGGGGGGGWGVPARTTSAPSAMLAAAQPAVEELEVGLVAVFTTLVCSQNTNF
jgi:hypothetical protein